MQTILNTFVLAAAKTERDWPVRVDRPGVRRHFSSLHLQIDGSL